MSDFLNAQQLEGLDAYWRAANYLAVGQIYLKDNPLLKEPLRRLISNRVCWGIGARRRGLT
jgi:xylulose-5-phosphate/fructose-6-phosphate phosphoketolase